MRLFDLPSVLVTVLVTTDYLICMLFDLIHAHISSISMNLNSLSIENLTLGFVPVLQLVPFSNFMHSYACVQNISHLH